MDSKETHLKNSKKRRKTWVIKGIAYPTIREASKATNLSMSSLIKYTKNNIFDIEAYIQGCEKANKIPKKNYKLKIIIN